MLISTYQHDYPRPDVKRYDFMTGTKGKASKDAPMIVECQCIEPDRIQAPVDAGKECAGVEWTGIAPMGRLVDPRLIPAELAQEQADKMAFSPETDCLKLQPNRFLKILRTVYPDLYERLKILPKEDLTRRLENTRMHTTYQIDYCNINEYPEGIYASLKTENDSSNPNADKLLTKKAPCSEFRANVMKELDRETSQGYDVSLDECEKSYKPVKTSFADSSRFVNTGDNSHWNAAPSTFRKQPTFSEYMDSISRNGCIIMRNKLHDHSKCFANYCKHELKDMCTDMFK